MKWTTNKLIEVDCFYQIFRSYRVYRNNNLLNNVFKTLKKKYSGVQNILQNHLDMPEIYAIGELR